LYGIWIIFREIIRAILLRNFKKKKVEPILPTVEKHLEMLNSLFVPNRYTSDEDIERFSEDTKETRDAVCNLYTKKPTIFNEYLDTTSIKSYKKLVTPYELKKRQKENNSIADAIEKLKALSSKATETYKALTDDNHYFTYSEMELFQQSLIEVETLSKAVLPKYVEYLGEDEKNLLGIYNGIEAERKLHNQSFIQKELTENKTYFDTVLGQYPLDPQQRDSLVKLEDNCLVIASAGSGKTSTILGKAKYLVEKRKIDPSKILLITYTRKAANELHERMKIEGITCSTFHALAYQIIAKVTGQAPSICEADVTLNVFHKLIETNKNFLHAINNYIINQQSLMGLEHDYTDAFSYFEDRKKYGIQALFRDVDGKIIFTRSEEEKRLVSILTKLGVPFRYENAYQYNTTTPERRQYRPDFTIYYQNSQGQWQWLYLEHFGIDAIGNVPQWFGEGTRGGWRVANQKYNEGIIWKRNTHRQYGTILIETTSADFRDGTVEAKLRQQLTRYGVPIKERTDEELYELLVKRNRKVEKSVYTLIFSFITLMKANEKTIDGLLKDLEPKATDSPLANAMPQDIRSKVILTDIIKPFYEEYERTLNRSYDIDFTDAIIQATDLCRKGLWRHYDYILVDEFQDISIDRYKLLQALRSDSPKTKLFSVGDDWQSIFRFAGSDMSLVYEFEKYFGYTEQCKIETTYRFHQPLIDKSSEFVMKNKEQKEKTIKTPEGDTKKTYLNFVKCDGEDEEGVKKEVEKIVSAIPTNQSILLLGRYNYDAVSVGYKGKMDMTENRMTVKVGIREIPFLSVHSAKGLEADNVILVNCNQGAYGFPSLIEDDPILDFVLSKSEAYPFAEERRLFYVAMTRARMKMYVLYDQKRPSPFIGEFLLRIERGSYLCPRCLEGKMVAIKDGQTTNGEAYRSYVCSNRESGCDFFETKYGDLTPPGILITEEMTAQDIEKLREERRSRRIPILSQAPQTQFRYGTQAPVARHNPVRGFAAPFPPPPIVDESHEGSADDLPF
jgi:DNA helicase-4